MICDLDNLSAEEIPEFLAAGAGEHGKQRRIELDGSNAALGLGRLAVAIVNLLHELLERQAIRRMDQGTLNDDEVERVGECLMQQSEAIDQLCSVFGIARSELNLDLGPLGKLI
jgi:hypothetical protein